jgi:hypothetical protein
MLAVIAKARLCEGFKGYLINPDSGAFVNGSSGAVYVDKKCARLRRPAHICRHPPRSS